MTLALSPRANYSGGGAHPTPALPTRLLVGTARDCSPSLI